jgi:hypothetical protein
MKKLTTALILMLTSGAALAVTPRGFLEQAASSAGWSVPAGRDLCAAIAENGRKGSWPADPKSILKYITTFAFLSESSAQNTKYDIESISGMTPNIAWRDYGNGTYSRIYDGRLTKGYAFNFSLINTVDDDGLTGSSLVCVGVYGVR